MNIFVTGATGVLGRPVVTRLVEAGHAVTALSRSDRNDEILSDLGATPFHGDLFDAGQLARGMTGCSAVLHLATRIPPASEMKSPTAWDDNDRIRRDGTAALVKAAEAAGTVDTVIYPSICFIYADGGADTLSADSATVAEVPPVASTIDAEDCVAGFAREGEQPGGRGRRGIVLRFGAFYGPASGDSRQMLAMARKGLALPLAPATTYKSMIWIDDAAAAVVAALDNAPSGVFDVVEDTPFTQAEAVASLAAAVGRPRLRRLPRWLLRFAVPGNLRTVLGRSQRVSSARFKELTGWQPTVPNQAEGWRRLAADVS